MPRAYDPEAIRAQYPQMAFLIDDPVIGGILREAYVWEWPPSRFQAAIMATEWWRTQSDTNRSYRVLANTDPESLRQREAEKTRDVQRVAAELGLEFGLGFAPEELGRAALFWGWTDAELRRQLAWFANTRFSSRSPLTARVRSLSQQFFMPLSEESVIDWARKLAAGQETEETFRLQLNAWAKSMFPHLSDRLDAGLSMAQIAEPYRQTIAQLLEISPDTVDFVKDDRWRQALSFVDDKGQNRTMSMWELGQHVRGQNEYRMTNQGRSQGADVAEFLAREFGKVA